MFDLIFDTLFDFFSTWEALGLLLMGTVFIAFGLGFICYELYWRIKAEKLSAAFLLLSKMDNIFILSLRIKPRTENHMNKQAH
ncbi:MAG: hypothetical protein P8H03_06530 [Emcibacteraceae bacterium]|nr:hypothetical protein [Emcibacteraceae bacterium]